MSRTDVYRWSRAQLARRRVWRRWFRIGIVVLGFGLGTAFAADSVSTTEPAPADDVTYGGAVSQWRIFDPGFVVDHLPFKLTVSQSISYNDNVQYSATSGVLVDNNALLRLPSRGDFYSDTTISGASTFPMGAQSFFFNGTYAPRRYFRDTVYNADNYSLNGGVDFNAADRCTGRLIVGQDSNQANQFDTAGLGIYTTTTTSFNETARCRISGHVAGLFNSGVSKTENTGDAGLSYLSFALNNYQQHYVSGGLEYALTNLDLLRGTATFTNREFANRPANLGLASNTEQDDYLLFYSRTISAKLDANIAGGISLFDLGPGTAEMTEPIFSFNVNYRITPKLAASFSESRSTGAPQSVISNVQTSDTQSLSLSYRYSPRLSMSGILSRTASRNPGLSSATLPNGVPLLYTNSNQQTASIVAVYSVSPLTSATASYSYTERTDTFRSGLNAVSNIFRVGLTYTR